MITVGSMKQQRPHKSPLWLTKYLPLDNIYFKGAQGSELKNKMKAL